jgi:hypothetical protein
VPLGTVTYNLFRPDVAALFPGLANSGGPVGYRMIDTTALAEGQHTIAWVVTDDQGAAAGIGSRYFTVANSADAQPPGSGSVTTAPTNEAEPADVVAPALTAKTGPDAGRRTASLAESPVQRAPVLMQRSDATPRRVRASEDGSRTLTVAAMERFELTLEESAACAGTWAGYTVDRDTLRELPVGAAIDPAGTFYWQPGPGFIGTFELLFVRTACDGAKTKLPVTVTTK